MSLNRTLDRLFDEIRREAKRNPEFANRMDAVMRGHTSSRDVPDEVIEEIAKESAEPVAAPVEAEKPATKTTKATPKPTPAKTAAEEVSAPALNPIGIYQREGEEALKKALEPQGLPALLALVEEHNLDPTGDAAELDRDALVAHVIDQARRRAERDKKMFDY